MSFSCLCSAASVVEARACLRKFYSSPPALRQLPGQKNRPRVFKKRGRNNRPLKNPYEPPLLIRKCIGSISIGFNRAYTSSIKTSIAASPLRGPIFTIRVYPPLRLAYLGAISSKSLSARLIFLVAFFLPEASVGTSVSS